jgi:hypothetical protein
MSAAGVAPVVDGLENDGRRVEELNGRMVLRAD